jgi:hypothetical protein
MKTVVKLTSQSVAGEIEKVLDTYAYNPYQQAFAIPDLRQELLDYVVSRIPSIDSDYVVEKGCINYKFPRNPLEVELHLQNLINQGIYSIFQEKSDWIGRCLCDTLESSCEPSHWFG